MMVCLEPKRMCYTIERRRHFPSEYQINVFVKELSDIIFCTQQLQTGLIFHCNSDTEFEAAPFSCNFNPNVHK